MPRGNILTFPDSRAAAAEINVVVRDGDLVLVKGSRGMRTDLIVDKLRAREKE